MEMKNVQTLTWALSDPEQRLGFKGGRYTHVNSMLSGLMAILLTLGVFLAVFPLRERMLGLLFYRETNLPVAIPITFLTSWSFAILLLKWWKLRLQRKTLEMQVLPPEVDFCLSPQTVEHVEKRIGKLVDDPKHFVLVNRVWMAISNLRNLGRVGDVAEIFKTQSEHDEASVETSYLMVGVFVWAIPVLGFVGTVLGLSQSIGKFGGVLQGGGGTEQITEKLQKVTGGLATAFETTLIGLVAALLVQVSIVAMRKAEHQFLDSCNEYCSRNVILKLRLLPFEQSAEGTDHATAS